MINFKNIFGYFHCRGYGNLAIKPARDWKLILMFFVVLLIIISLISFGVFLSYKNKIDSEIDISEEKGIMTVNRTDLKKVLEDIRARSANFEKNLIAPEIEDPSL